MLSHLRSSACFETSADSFRTFVLVNENKSTEKNTSTGKTTLLCITTTVLISRVGCKNCHAACISTRVLSRFGIKSAKCNKDNSAR